MTDMVPITNPFLKELLQTFLTVGGRKGKIDFDELGIKRQTSFSAMIFIASNKWVSEVTISAFSMHSRSCLHTLPSPMRALPIDLQLISPSTIRSPCITGSWE